MGLIIKIQMESQGKLYHLLRDLFAWRTPMWNIWNKSRTETFINLMTWFIWQVLREVMLLKMKKRLTIVLLLKEIRANSLKIFLISLSLSIKYNNKDHPFLLRLKEQLSHPKLVQTKKRSPKRRRRKIMRYLQYNLKEILWDLTLKLIKR